jgi:proteasome lid subunit RPN8/RPN11
VPGRIQLPAALAREIEWEAVRAYPDECCGILMGTDSGDSRVVASVRHVANQAQAVDRPRRFSIDPRQLMDADRDAAARELEVIGFYHSHPDQPARPSEFDRQNAWPFYSYIIVSILDGEPVDMTCWILDDETKSFARQEIVEGESVLETRRT